MDKRITKLSRDPYYVGLADRPISMFIDPPTGDVLIDEGNGKARMYGAVLHADNGIRFSCTPADSGCVVKVHCKTFVWEVGWAEDAVEAAKWVQDANTFLAMKKDALRSDKPNVNGTFGIHANSPTSSGAEQKT